MKRNSNGAFNAFVESDEGKELIAAEFRERLLKSGVVVTTLTSLQKFARERWPDDYPRDWRTPTPPDAKYGRETTGDWWGQYLEWSESRDG